MSCPKPIVVQGEEDGMCSIVRDDHILQCDRRVRPADDEGRRFVVERQGVAYNGLTIHGERAHKRHQRADVLKISDFYIKLIYSDKLRPKIRL